MKKVLILQRSIPNYRLPLFQALCASGEVEITIGCAEHDEATSTGIPADDYSGLRLLPVRVHRVGGKLLYISGVSFRSFDLVITDMSINIISLPLCLLQCRLQGIPVIGWGKGVPQRLDLPESWLNRRYKKTLAGSCRALIVYGQISKKYFENLGLGRKPMFLAQNSVHTERFIEHYDEHAAGGRKLRQKLGFQDRFVFSYFGKLTARKKVDTIIEAFRMVRTKQPDVRLLIAGTGPDQNRLEAMAADLVKEGHLIFMGRVPNGEEGSVLHAMDAYLSFSQGGLGILEAMATARTIISTPEVFPETELLIGGENCLLSEDFSTGAYAAAMEQAIRESEQSRALGIKAQQTVKEKAGTHVMVNAFLNAIRHTINQ